MLFSSLAGEFFVENPSKLPEPINMSSREHSFGFFFGDLEVNSSAGGLKNGVLLAFQNHLVCLILYAEQRVDIDIKNKIQAAVVGWDAFLGLLNHRSER